MMLAFEFTEFHLVLVLQVVTLGYVVYAMRKLAQNQVELAEELRRQREDRR